MEKRRYIRRMLRMAALAVGMVLTGGASAWGQVGEPSQYNYHQEWDFCYDRPDATIVNQQDPVGLSETIDTIYVTPGYSVDITLQYAPTGENLNGYIRWFVEKNGQEVLTNLQRPTSSNHNLGNESFWPEEGLVQYKNGYAWFRYAKNDYRRNVLTPHGGYSSWLSNIKSNNGNDITLREFDIRPKIFN